MTETPLIKPKSTRIIVLGVTVLAAIATSTLIFAVAYHLLSAKATKSSSPSKTLVSVKRSPVDAVAAQGRLEPQGEVINLSAPNSSESMRVERILVKVGDKVKTGEAIAILDNRDRLQAALKRSQTQVRVAQARLAKIQAGAKKGAIEAKKANIKGIEAELQGQTAAHTANIDRIKAELHNAQTECSRHQKLYRDGAISASERDNTCLKQNTLQDQLKEAQATRTRTEKTLLKQLSEAQATLEEIAEVRPVDVGVAVAELEEAQAAMKQAQANLNSAYVRAPENGQILKIHTRSGEAIADKGIVAIGKTDQMYAIAEVYETDISKIRVGQKAKITSFGFLGALSGRVDEIGLQIGKKDVLSTDPTADVDSRVVEVKIRLDRPASQKVAGLTNLQVNVDVVIDLNEGESRASLVPSQDELL
jgi:HlyD family secretion protein